jgi:NADPH:quinone reductase-like Zn-dependent oxidoreductase
MQQQLLESTGMRRTRLLGGALLILAAVMTFSAGIHYAVAGEPMTVPSTQKQYRVARSGTEGPFKLQMADAPVRQPGANEVLVKVHAVSLNRRDIFLVKGQYNTGGRNDLVPLSDGAGEVVAIGPGVTRFHVGDRVAAIFFQSWISGRPGPKVLGSALGGSVDGMLSQYVTLSEQGLVAVPASLSYEQAATLPCAGVTAWNGLFTRGRLKAGDYVLLEGTGGVSVLGLQLAVAAGAKPIITSSNDEKLKRATALGAIGTVNYKKTPDWETPVRELTGGVGVHQVLEVGGKDTLPHALKSLAQGGHIALIGGLSSFGGDIPAMALMGTNSTASGIYVGSRADFEAMNAFIEKHHVKPVVDRVFDFKDAQAAFDLMESDNFFGKIVIRL